MYEYYKEKMDNLTKEQKQQLVKEGDLLLKADSDTKFLSDENLIVYNLCKKSLEQEENKMQ